MVENVRGKKHDLEDRTLKFAGNIAEFVNDVPKTIPNIEFSKQLVRSAGSIGANYIEANEALSKRDFSMRVKICRKEAKETCYWLKLVKVKRDSEEKKQALIQESNELMKIFGSIVEKTKL